MEKEKICIKCKRGHTLGSFYRNNKNKDGLHSWCVDCCREANLKRYDAKRWKEYYEKDKKRRDEYQISYYAKNRERVSARCHAYNQKNRAHQNELHVKWKKNNPMAVKAHNLVYEALKKGTLTKLPFCEICNRNGFVESHHEDYSYPLNVLWICRSHHRRHHRGNHPELSEKIKKLYQEKFIK